MSNVIVPGLDAMNDPEMIYRVGECYWDGSNGMPQNYDYAIACYEKAGEMGHLESIYSLGYCYANGFGKEVDIAKADKLLSYAAYHGHLMATVKLGDYLYWGDVMPKDRLRGYKYLKKAADEGHAHSMAVVGDCLITGYDVYYGNGPIKDFEQGKSYLEKACDMDEPYGLFLLGNMYRLGTDGFPENPNYGVQLLKRSAELGHSYAQLEYAIACFRGEGTERNEREYARWMKASAERGNEEAVVRWAWTRLIGSIEGVRCQTESEYYEIREILDEALENGDDFLNQEEIRNLLLNLSDEERRLGRRLTLRELYG